MVVHGHSSQYSLVYTVLSQDIKVFLALQDVPTTPLKIIKQPTLNNNVIIIKVEGTKPISYKWFKDEEQVCDGDNYKGSTTHELFVRNLNPLTKGMYVCKIHDKCEQSICSDSITFGKVDHDLFNCCYTLYMY